MKPITRVAMLLVLLVVGVGIVACAAHAEDLFGSGSTTLAWHGVACGLPLLTAAAVTAFSFLPLTGSQPYPAGPQRMLARPVYFFQPPERPS